MRPLARAAWLTGVTLAGILLSSTTLGDEWEQTAVDRLLPRAPDTWHRQELRVGWTVYSATLSADRYFNHSGAFVDFAPYVPLWLQRFRPAISTGISFGHWGDDRHGLTSFHQGVKARGGFGQIGGVLEVYVLSKFMVLWSLGRDDHLELDSGWGLQPGLGLGAQLFGGYLALEGTFDVTIAVGDDGFWPRDEPRPVDATRVEPAALSIYLNTDLCVLGNAQWCQHSKRSFKTRVVDVTPRLLLSAQSWAEGLGHLEHQQLCAAVDASLEAEGEFLGELGSTGAFLGKVEAALQSPSLQQRVADLRKEHEQLSDCRKRSLRASKEARKSGRALRHKVAYAPYPPDLRNVMRCESGVEPEEVKVSSWHTDWLCK